MIKYWKRLNIYLKIGMTGSILGCILVAANYAFLANLIWLICNPCMLIHNYKVKEHEQVILWGIYVIIAFAGVFNHILPFKKILDFFISGMV
jgi:hypothetical protein